MMRKAFKTATLMTAVFAGGWTASPVLSETVRPVAVETLMPVPADHFGNVQVPGSEQLFLASLELLVPGEPLEQSIRPRVRPSNIGARVAVSSGQSAPRAPAPQTRVRSAPRIAVAPAPSRASLEGLDGVWLLGVFR